MAVSSQVDRVLIVDNYSDNVKEIRSIVQSYSNTELIENSDNDGLAAALNQLCDMAMNEGYEWILTLDQDTLIPDGMIDVFSAYVNDDKNAIICPAVYYEGWGKTVRGKGITDVVKACMTSGSFTRLSAWKEVGAFREDFFIDFVDNEFCIRLSLI